MQSGYLYLILSDINECEEIPNACNLTVSNCTNTFGSFECLRLEGGCDKNNSASFYVIPGTTLLLHFLMICLQLEIM